MPVGGVQAAKRALVTVLLALAAAYSLRTSALPFEIPQARYKRFSDLASSPHKGPRGRRAVDTPSPP